MGEIYSDGGLARDVRKVGGPTVIITRTPSRLSLLGGGSDYLNSIQQFGGWVVGGSVNLFTYITVRRLPHYHPFKTRVVYNQIEEVNSNDEIKHKAIHACLKQADLMWEPLEIFHQSDIPGRCGIGSSSSFIVGLLNALAAYKREFLSKAELTSSAIQVEQEILQECVGLQDSVWAAHGGLNQIRFQKNGAISLSPLTISLAQIRSLEAHTLLIYTGLVRIASEVASTYVPSLGAKPKEQYAMISLAQQGVEAIQRGDWEALGGLIDQSWRIKSRLSPTVSNPEIGSAYATARTYGAIGGKLIGAGAGGCILLIAKPELHTDIMAALPPHYRKVPFHFDFTGSTVIFAERGMS